MNIIGVPSLCITNCAVCMTSAWLRPESSTQEFSAQPSSWTRAPDMNQHFWRHQLTGIYQISRYIYLKIFTLLSEILVWFWWQGLNDVLLFACWHWSLRGPGVIYRWETKILKTILYSAPLSTKLWLSWKRKLSIIWPYQKHGQWEVLLILWGNIIITNFLFFHINFYKVNTTWIVCLQI